MISGMSRTTHWSQRAMSSSHLTLGCWRPLTGSVRVWDSSCSWTRWPPRQLQKKNADCAPSSARCPCLTYSCVQSCEGSCTRSLCWRPSQTVEDLRSPDLSVLQRSVWFINDTVALMCVEYRTFNAIFKLYLYTYLWHWQYNISCCKQTIQRI